MKILSLGHLTYDLTMSVDSYPKENTKVNVYEKNEGVGGSAAVASLLLSKWNEEVYLAGKVGDDNYGHFIKKELALKGINTNFVQMNKEYKTSNNINIINNESGAKTIFAYDSKDGQMKDVEIDFIPDIILIDGYEYEMSKAILKSFNKSISILNAGKETPEILELMKKVDYIICSKEFAESVSMMKFDYDNKHTFVEIYQTLEKQIKGKLIITLEEKGCMYRDENKIKLMPSIKVKEKDTTGAGDIFHGAFAYALANNFDLEKALKYSNIAGCLSVTKMGTGDATPTLKEVEDVYAEIG